MNEILSSSFNSGFVGAAVLAALLSALLVLSGCGEAVSPGARNATIPTPTSAEKRAPSITERPDSVIYLPLGEDVLVPVSMANDPLPKEVIGPFELRSETLAGALQLILADYDIPLAFETEEGLNRRITVANLKGPLNKVVSRVCGLADLYCAHEDGLLVIKETQTFTVSIPPVGEGDEFVSSLSRGLQAITGLDTISDSGTRTLVYEATHRTAELAERYFQRIRKNTALIVFEIYIWEVALNTSNDTGINWSQIDTFGKFDVGLNLAGGTLNESPISIGLPTTQGVDFARNVLQFISSYGAVKTISQPQITLLSGSEASLRVADTQNFISSLDRTVDDGEISVTTQTDTVDTGFTLTISGAWDNATVYGNIEIEVQEFRGFEPFDTETTTLRLPETTERELTTQVRIRPGDSLLIAGLIRENDELDRSGPGLMDVFLPTSRQVSASNVELVFLLRPKVVVYTDDMPEEELFVFDGLDYEPPVEINPDLTYGVVEPKYRVSKRRANAKDLIDYQQPRRDVPPETAEYYPFFPPEPEHFSEEKNPEAPQQSPSGSVPLDLLNPASGK